MAAELGSLSRQHEILMGKELGFLSSRQHEIIMAAELEVFSSPIMYMTTCTKGKRGKRESGRGRRERVGKGRRERVGEKERERDR